MLSGLKVINKGNCVT